MRLQNLARAIAEREATGYQTAAAAKMTESAFSQGLNGRRFFFPEQRKRIAEFLNLQERWLFAPLWPPSVRAGLTTTRRTVRRA